MKINKKKTKTPPRVRVREGVIVDSDGGKIFIINLSKKKTTD